MVGKTLSIILLIFMFITFPIFFVVASLIWLLTVLIDKRLVLLQLFTCFWGSLYTWVMPIWWIKVQNRKKFNKKTPYVIVSNHQSQLDILVTYRLFLHYKIVSKAEIFKVPFLGWNMSLNRYIKLVRGDRDSILKMMTSCEKTLKSGSSVLLYPEGTRSRDGEIKTFKAGAFSLAKDMQVPILPIIINGTGDALPKKTMKSKGFHKITVSLMDEIPYSKFENLTIKETSDMVRELMIEELAEMKKSEKTNS